ncbi:adenosine deaminase [Paraburkholderia tropica]|uniref:adenosine deaminase n=1 Tax=Paraburkholderia tropica TaxID=92647 RepID=UPI002AB741C0|nr:adenosine deaminase [Paraburkholderia tropica]
MSTIHELIRALPKAELHLHLEGSVSVTTLLDLAAKHGKRMPPDITPDTLFQFNDLDDFIRVASLTFSVMLDADDFSRVTFEMLEQSALHGARHVEFFFSPSSHPTLSYASMLEGIRDGMLRARELYGMSSMIIPSHNRMLGHEASISFIDMVVAERCDEVVGIGLEFAELPFPPEQYETLYRRAEAAGLRLTAHAGEEGPAGYVRTSVRQLGCRRIDHGYHIVDDPALVEECRELNIAFTCCPTTTRHTTIWKNPADIAHPIHQMIKAGLKVSINTDDPGFFQTDLTTEYASLNLPFETLGKIAMDSLETSWLPAHTKRLWGDEWRAIIRALEARSAALPS